MSVHLKKSIRCVFFFLSEVVINLSGKRVVGSPPEGVIAAIVKITEGCYHGNYHDYLSKL